MEKYIKSLKALYYLFKLTEVEAWETWIEKDLALASIGDVSHHLSAYGGMGTINDLWICVGNGHKISKNQEPFVQYLFEDLKAICFTLANNYIKSTSKEINRNIMWGKPKYIQGCRCLSCGHGEITRNDILNYILPELIGAIVLKAFNDDELIKCVDTILNMDVYGLESEMEMMQELVKNAKITYIHDYKTRMNSCPHCGKKDIAVYRWEIKENFFKIQSLIASKDNLKVKN